VAYIAVRHELRTQIDRQLHRQAREVRPTPVLGPAGRPRFKVDIGAGDLGGYSAVVGADGSRGSGFAALPIAPADIVVARTGRGVVIRDATYNGVHVRMITEPLPGVQGYAMQIALPLTDVDRQLAELALAFAVLAAGGLALTVLVSWGAVRRVTRPVRTLTEAAEQIATTRDLTLRIAAEGNDELGRLAVTFNTMLDALERSVDAQRQLIMDASHELRTPLASLRTNVEVLNDVERLSPEQRQALLKDIVTQLEELTGLVADVVELARGEAPASDHSDIAFDELVVRAVERAGRHWPSVAFRLTSQPVTVRGVTGRLDRAVANMLDNAGKFSPPGAPVDVALAADGSLTVADRGPGVPDEALPHVFDRFYRADEARALPGSGLGLAIVQQVAEGHGGTISMANRPGGGAVAMLVLPAAAGPAQQEDEPPAATPAELTESEVPLPVEESLFR
ncbi:MAG: two-component system, OmpR family, sensor histidine kinase MprB, partial [Frankiaceae bacterium]|nr:two-component system, OmpR family, sensor histidine kinase MprB [Frankiaceae bacterium]